MKRFITVAALTVLIGLQPVFAKPASTTKTLSAEQKAALLYMYQEEKVARDVYYTLGKKYPAEKTFANIQLSEQQHIDAVESLCVKYKVDISGVNESEVGTFVLTDLGNLYNQLVEEGSPSLTEALKVGVKIEKQDIEDILAYEVGMPSDVVKVFENLRAGSLNHLSAFESALSATK